MATLQAKPGRRAGQRGVTPPKFSVRKCPSGMRIVIVFNPKSGRGRAGTLSAEFARALRAEGHEVEPVAIGPHSEAPIQRWLKGAGALVVMGGDGTLHAMLPAAAESGAPVYHVPLGTENLFAREFGMTTDVRRLCATIARAESRAIDMGECGGRPFAIMASAGPDASVIHRLDAARNGAISHLSYAPHILAEFMDPRLPPMTIECDGEVVARDQPGMVVVANLRQYALRIDPACDAKADDGLLDVVLFPARSAWGVLWWEAKSMLRVHQRDPRLIYRRAREVRVTSPVRLPVQIDGEAAPIAAITARVRAGALRVLVPAE